MAEKIKFAAYGTLRTGRHNRPVLGDATSLGIQKTKPEYTLFDGGFPIVERGGDTPITVEVFETDDQDIIDSVFQLEGCTKVQGSPHNWYDFDKIQTDYGEAIMFVMDKGKSGRNHIIPHGDWCK